MPNNEMKWQKRVKPQMVGQILEMEPDAVKFHIEKPYVFCTIELEHEVGTGFAICSPLDPWNEKAGATIAAGRAMKALKNKSSCGFVRHKWYQFPNTWTKSHMNRLLAKRRMAKCSYYLRDRTSDFETIKAKS